MKLRDKFVLSKKDADPFLFAVTVWGVHGDDQAVGLERALVPETERCLPYVQETSVAVGFVGFVVVLDAQSREHVGDGDVLG